MCPFLGFKEIQVKVRAGRKYLHTLFKINKLDPLFERTLKNQRPTTSDGQ